MGILAETREPYHYSRLWAQSTHAFLSLEIFNFGEEYGLLCVVLENVVVNGISSVFRQSESLTCNAYDITMPKKEISQTIAANSAIAFMEMLSEFLH